MRFVNEAGLALVLVLASSAAGETSAPAAPATPAKHRLTPQAVVDAVLAKSYRAVEIGLNARTGFIAYEEALGRFDFKLDSQLSYEYKEAETLSLQSNPVDKTLLAGLALQKPTQMGAEISLAYTHQAQSSILSPLARLVDRPAAVALDSAKLQWRQHLWSNAFGLSDRLDLSVARAQLRQSELSKQEETEGLVLDSLKCFWDAFVAQNQLEDALAARKQYEALIGVVRRRGRFGLDKGGEYAQVMADFTDADAQVKQASLGYLDKLKELELLMRVEFESDVDFSPGEILPGLPRFGSVDIDELRAIRIAARDSQNEFDHARSVEWRGRPSVDLIASASSTGVEERAGAAYSEFVSGNKPTYFVGLEFTTALDSSDQRAKNARARAQAERAANRLASLRARTSRELGLLDRRVQEAYAVAQSAIDSEKYRSRTVREEEQEYRQGRLALRDLLKTYRDFFAAQARKIRAIGDYHIALNEMAAERDELVR